MPAVPLAPETVPASPPIRSRDLLAVVGYAVLVVVLALSGVSNSGFLV